MANNEVSLSLYIRKVLAQVHHDIGIGSKAMMEMNELLRYVASRLCDAIRLLLTNYGRTTISSRDVQYAVQLILPGELAKHAISEGTKAVTKWNASVPKKSKKSAGMPKKQAGESHTKAARAGLQMAPPRVKHLMQSFLGGKKGYRYGAGASIYMAAVLEYLAAEILELSGNAARDNKRQRIVGRHIMLCIRNDEELSKVFHRRRVFLAGGVTPNILAELLPKTKSKKSEGA